MDKTSLTLGWLVGRRIAGQRTKKTLVGYSYNGVVLPALPEWDDKTYPYAVIYVDSTTGKYCCVFEKTKQRVIVSTFISLWASYYQMDSGVWENRGSGTVGGKIVWANHDVYYANNEENGELSGTLYLSASNPIPVYA